MNILFASFLQPDAPSGVRVHYLQLAELLRQRGHRVDFVTTGSLTGWRRKAVGALRHGLHWLGPFTRALAVEMSNFQLIQRAINTRQEYDLVHAHDAGSGVAASRALGGHVPVVVTGHFNGHPGKEVVLQNALSGLSARQTMRWHNFLLANTRYFIGVSEYVCRQTAPLLPAGALHAKVHNGIDLKCFGQAPPDAELQRLARGRHVLLNVGHLEPRKNQQFLLRVAQELLAYRQDFVVAFAGSGPDETLLRQQIAARGLQDVALLLGQRHEVAPLLRASTLYVHTATNESFGLVLLEAMACGVPALALAVGGIPEVLAAAPEALLPATASATAVARHLHGLLDSPAACADLQRRQADYAATHFDAAQMVEATLVFYRDTIRHFEGQCGHDKPTQAAPLHAAPTPTEPLVVPQTTHSRRQYTPVE